MDPLSIAASVAGFLSLTKDVVELVKAYTDSVKSAPSEVEGLLIEIKLLEHVLEQLKGFLEKEEVKGNFKETSLLYSIVEICRTQIQTVDKKLQQFRVGGEGLKEKESRFKLIRDARFLKWPFNREECQKMADTLHRCAQIFQLSLTIGNGNLLSKTVAELEKVQDSLQSAAAFLPELAEQSRKLQTIMDLASTLPLVGAKIDDIHAGVQMLNLMASDEQRARLIQLLSPLEPVKRHQDVQHIRLPNTGSWLLEHDRFKGWIDNDKVDERDASERILSCYGMPGAGKTVISSLVIDHIKAQYTGQGRLRTGVICMYCDYRDTTNQTVVNILGSFVQQLLRALPLLPKEVIEILYNIERESKRLVTDEAVFMLKFTTKQFGGTFICIDALDELETETRISLLELLGEVINDNASTRLFLTGRPQIQEEVNTLLGHQEAIVISANQDDIVAFLKHKIAKDPKRTIAMDKSLEKDIVATILGHSQGMFLLPALHIRVVLQQTTKAKRRRALAALPPTLDAAFEDTIARIQRSDMGELGMRVLMWIHLAYRPLHIEALLHALAVEPGDIELNEENIEAKETLLESCCGLVMVDEETLTIRFVHYTLQEFFRKRTTSYFPDGNGDIAESCLTYLNFEEWELVDESEIQPESWFNYAACHWGFYARQQFTDSVKELAIKLLTCDSQEGHGSMRILAKSVVDEFGIMLNEVWADDDDSVVKLFSGVHAVAYFGLDEIVQKWAPKQGWDSKDNEGRTPLSRAAELGYENVVRRLLETKSDVDVNSMDGSDRTPLSFAAEHGHKSIVELLLKREDIDADAGDRSHKPLVLAVSRGHEDIVRMLVQRKEVSVESKMKAMSSAAQEHRSILNILLENSNMDINSKNQAGQTLLSLAAGWGYSDIIKDLLQRKDIILDTKDGSGQTPLHKAAQAGCGEILQLLLETGKLKADAKDREGRTPLFLAAGSTKAKTETVVRLLLARDDVNAEARERNGKTPLQIAAHVGNLSITRLFLQRDGVDVNSRDYLFHWTPLIAATTMGRRDVAKLLLEDDRVKADMADSEDRTALSKAAQGDLGDVMEMLMRKDVDVNSKDKTGRTPLSWAAENGRVECVKLLLGREDVEIGLGDKDGKTPLDWAKKVGDEEVVRLLEKNGTKKLN